MRVDQGVAARRRQPARPRRPRRRAVEPAARRRSATSSASDVVGGAAVAQRARAAGVVADHAADGARGCAWTGRGRSAARAAAAARCSVVAGSTPGWTAAVRGLGVDRRAPGSGAGRSRARRRRRRRCPAIDVPAPRTVTGTPAAGRRPGRPATSSTCRGRPRPAARPGSSRRPRSTGPAAGPSVDLGEPGPRQRRCQRPWIAHPPILADRPRSRAAGDRIGPNADIRSRRWSIKVLTLVERPGHPGSEASAGDGAEPADGPDRPGPCWWC